MRWFLFALAHAFTKLVAALAARLLIWALLIVTFVHTLSYLMNH